jgi:4,5:9,10-diseco-3-hydroxy-5,9,17-trioxoandrosta-1(10),2-diene-4-oate hydrolase
MTTQTATKTLNQRTVPVGTRQIFLSEAGTGDVVLLLHGGGPGASGVSSYVKNIDALARHFRVLVPDLPGYGQSSKGINPNDPFGDLAMAMLGLLDQLGIQRAHIIGNSLGGACALRMAIERPWAVDRLILLAPGGIDSTRGLPTPGLKRLLGYYKGQGPSPEKLAALTRGDLVYDGRHITEEMLQEQFLASIDPAVLSNPPLQNPKGIPNFSKLDFTRNKRLGKVQNRTLLFWGTNDRISRPASAHSLQRRLQNCDVVLYNKTGHWIQWERAHEFNAAATSFLTRATPMN